MTAAILSLAAVWIWVWLVWRHTPPHISLLLIAVIPWAYGLLTLARTLDQAAKNLVWLAKLPGTIAHWIYTGEWNPDY